MVENNEFSLGHGELRSLKSSVQLGCQGESCKCGFETQTINYQRGRKCLFK